MRSRKKLAGVLVSAFNWSEATSFLQGAEEGARRPRNTANHTSRVLHCRILSLPNITGMCITCHCHSLQAKAHVTGVPRCPKVRAHS